MKDWKKITIPALLAAFLSVTATLYGISILPRIARNEQGIDRLITLVIELKEDVAEIRAILNEHATEDFTNRPANAGIDSKVGM